MRPPLLPAPTAKVNMTGTHQIEERVFKTIRTRFDVLLSRLRKFIDSRQYSVVQVNQNFYDYQLDDFLLANIDLTLDELFDELLLSGNEQHFMRVAAELGYEQATADAIQNIDNQLLVDYPRQLQAVIFSAPYRNRLRVISSRSFEDFKGFTDQMKTQLRRIMVDGMANGENPNKIAADINRNLFGGDGKKGNIARAKTIARTEITSAHRQAIRDEDMESNKVEGIRTKLMHISALLPSRTRRNHAARHGDVFTAKEVSDWYKIDGNAINCLCTQISVLVDASGNPINKAFQSKVDKQRLKYNKSFTGKV